MSGPRRSDPPPADQAGDDGTWRPSLGLLAVALAIVGGLLGYWWWSTPAPAEREVAQAASGAPAFGSFAALPASDTAASGPPRVAVSARASAPVAPPAASAPRIARVRDPNGDQSPDITDYINEGEVPTMAEVIDRLHQAGVHTGLGAFQPPGTRPPLIGLAVPEDFPLPEGYVRHYQATDDGQRIEPILMFAPDHTFYDAAGHPIAIPKDRVVPPELAPPGLPIRRIVVPKPIDTGRP